MQLESERRPQTPLFPPWSSGLLRWSVGAFFGAPIIGIAALIAWQHSPYFTGQTLTKPQPLQFDHRHHVRDLGIACTYCHESVDRSPKAGMPSVGLCMGCHAQIWNQSPELAQLRSSYFSGAKLAWQQVSLLPDYVFFDHSVHVTRGVACASCHGAVEQMARVHPVAPLTMSFCLDCHRAPRDQLPLAAARPGTDCTTCHR